MLIRERAREGSSVNGEVKEVSPHVGVGWGWRGQNSDGVLRGRSKATVNSLSDLSTQSLRHKTKTQPVNHGNMHGPTRLSELSLWAMSVQAAD